MQTICPDRYNARSYQEQGRLTYNDRHHLEKTSKPRGAGIAAGLTMAVLNWFPFRLSCVSRPCILAFPFLEPLQFDIICKYEEDVPIFAVN